VATETAAIVVLTPANFYHFRRPKFNFKPLSFTFGGLSLSLLRPLAKNLQKQKSLLRSMERKSKQKSRKKAFKSPAMKRQRFFYQTLSITAKVGGFLTAAEVLLKCYE
jgi:hypothetical protein